MAKSPTSAPASSSAPTVATGAADEPVAMPNPVELSQPAKFVPRVLRQVSQNLLKLRSGDQVYVQVTGPMAKAKPQKNASSEDKKKEPPTLLPVTNLETGEIQVIICGSVLVDLLNDEYPGDTYVNKGFAILIKEKKDGKGGKTYNTYDVREIAV